LQDKDQTDNKASNDFISNRFKADGTMLDYYPGAKLKYFLIQCPESVPEPPMPMWLGFGLGSVLLFRKRRCFNKRH
jgi:hypothetical protein